MARQFDIPVFYKSPIISRVKRARQIADPKKRDLHPSVLDFGPVRFLLARHFGFLNPQAHSLPAIITMTVTQIG